MSDSDALKPVLDRIAEALDRMSPRPPRTADFSSAEAFVWQADGQSFEPVAKVNRVPLALLKGIDRTAAILLDNTRRFAAGLPANNALLWGARGMGKSSLVKAAHADARSKAAGLKLDRNPPRGDFVAAEVPDLPQDRTLPVHRLLRRSLVRPR